MSTHSAECIPQPLASERRGRTLTRKTSLLRKIEPMARRSGFANRIICNPHSSHDENERRNDPEIVKGRAIARTIQLGSISSLRCQKSRRSLSGESCDMRKCFSRTMVGYGFYQQPVSSSHELRRARFGFLLRGCATRSRRRSVVEPDGIEPTTSCLQSTRSPS